MKHPLRIKYIPDSEFCDVVDADGKAVIRDVTPSEEVSLLCQVSRELAALLAVKPDQNRPEEEQKK